MKMIKKLIAVMAAVSIFISFTGCDLLKNEEDVNSGSVTELEGPYAEWAGFRSSPYGFGDGNFPSVQLWKAYVNKMQEFYNKNKSEKSAATLVWLVSTVTADENKSCWLTFPEPDGVEIPSGIDFNETDINEAYFDAFDEAGYSVWLQVESGLVDIEKLATVVMTQYKHHPCVKGFGIDAEWYQNITDGNSGTKVDDTTAEKVDKAIKKINPSYSLFIKHWRKDYLPKNYRGTNNDLIFVTDSQGFYPRDGKTALEVMQDYYADWANNYKPNPVFFQIGYDGDKENDDDPNEIGSDEQVWGAFNKPLKDFGHAILKKLKDNGQKRGIIWVDFTLKKAYKLSK